MPRNDSADDLHGYRPRDLTLCPECKRLAEPFAQNCCWNCTQDLKRAGVRVPAGRTPAKAKYRGRTISPVYTPVVTG